MATSIGDLAVILSADTGRAERKLHAFGGNVDRLDKKVRAFGGDGPRLKGMDAAGGKLRGGGAMLAGAGKAVPWVAAAAAGIEGLSLAWDGLKKSIELAGKAEANRVAFDTLLGSADLGGKLLAGLDAYAAKTAFSRDQTAELGKQLLGVGVEADQVLPAIRTFGDIAGTLGGDVTERMKRLTKAFGDVKANGRLAAEELNQFSEAGVNIGDALAKTMKKPREEIKALAAAGEIEFADVVKALNSMTAAGGQFAGGADKFAGTWQGQLGQIQDAAERLGAKLGDVVIKDFHLKDVLEQGARLFGVFDQRIDMARPGLRMLGDHLRVNVKLLTDTVVTSEKAAKVLLGMGKAFFAPEVKQFGRFMGQYKDILGEIERFDLEGAFYRGALMGMDFLEPFAMDVAGLIDVVADGFGKVDRVLKGLGATGEAAFKGMGLAVEFLFKPLDLAVAKLKLMGEVLKDPVKGAKLLADGTFVDKFVGDTFKDIEAFNLKAIDKLKGAGGKDPPAAWVKQKPEDMKAVDRVRDAFGFGRSAFKDLQFKHAVDNWSAALGPLAAELRSANPLFDLLGRQLDKATGNLGVFGGELTAGAKGLSAALRADAKKFNDQFADPTERLKKFAADLDRMEKFGAIDGRVKGLAFAAEADRLVKGRADERRPAPAIEYGSQQFAQLVQQAVGRGGPKDLAAAIRDMIAEQKEAARIGNEQLAELKKMAAPPKVVKMGGE